MFETLEIFDWDGTLFRSPLDTPENHKLFEEVTGEPWLVDKDTSFRLTKQLKRHVPMRRGWWGRRETLQPPLVPDPVPKEMFIEHVVAELRRSMDDASTMTILMTGRHAGLKPEFLRICHQGDLFEITRTESNSGRVFYDVVDPRIRCYLLGEDGPDPKAKGKPHETFPWKTWVMEQHLEIFSSIANVVIWEDRAEHVEKFRSLDLCVENTIVHHVIDGS